jgi:hypothetical protein
MSATLTTDPTPKGKRWHPALWGAAAALLALPLVAMQFDTGFDWTGSDFAIMGVVLATACGLYELGARMSGSTAYRAAFAVAILAGFLLVWINLAVGIVGYTFDPANLLFAAVLAIAGVGALLARFRARGMVRALVATAIAQAVAGTIALVAIEITDAEMRAIALMTALLVGLWLASAALFRKAAA